MHIFFFDFSLGVNHCAKRSPIEHNGGRLTPDSVGERELCHGGTRMYLRVCMLRPGKFSRMQASANAKETGDSKAAIGEALKQAIVGSRLQSISLHDERGDVLCTPGAFEFGPRDLEDHVRERAADVDADSPWFVAYRHSL